MGADFGLKVSDDLPRREIVFVHIGSQEVVPGLVGADALVEVSEVLEVFKVEELVFDGAVDGFYIAVVAPGLDGDPFMDGFEPLDSGAEAIAFAVLSCASDELCAVVGLEADALGIDPAVSKMLADDGSEETGIDGGLFACIAQEHQAGAYLASGELVFGQIQGLHLRPVMRDVLKIFGIDGELAQEFPSFFDLSKGGLSFVLLEPFGGQSMLFEDTADGLVAWGQSVHELQTFCAHEGIFFA